jgi:hypothetical protein
MNQRLVKRDLQINKLNSSIRAAKKIGDTAKVAQLTAQLDKAIKNQSILYKKLAVAAEKNGEKELAELYRKYSVYRYESSPSVISPSVRSPRRSSPRRSSPRRSSPRRSSPRRSSLRRSSSSRSSPRRVSSRRSPKRVANKPVSPAKKGGFYEKYMKYKAKYLELKNEMGL